MDRHRRIGCYRATLVTLYFANLLEGVIRFHQGRDMYDLLFEGEGDFGGLRDGSIGPFGLGGPEYAALAASGAQLVDIWPEITRTEHCLRLGHVLPDDEMVGTLAANYFLSRGYRNFAFFGYGKLPFSERRRKGYLAGLAATGRERQLLCAPDSLWEKSRPSAIPEWLLSLPKPIALFVADDGLASTVLRRCREIKILVPEEIGVLGVNNEIARCETMQPSLSSIDLNAKKVGYEAAALLHRMMDGAPGETIAVPPLPVITRASTNALGVTDKDVAVALQFIRDRGGAPIGVEDVAEHAVLSRRTLERRFTKAMGRTIQQEIIHAHIERARAMLRDTDMPMPKVAASSGFKTPQWMATLFKQKTGETPVEYRSRFRNVG